MGVLSEVERVKAVATFRQIGEEIYRTDTYIQFGTAKQSLGAVLMLNPGSADLKGEAKWQLHHTGCYTDEILLDSTMRQLVDFMTATHSKLEGRLYIYNLIYVRQTNHIDAINLFQHLKLIGKYPTISLPSLQEMKTHPWLLIGWGIETRKRWTYYESEKRKWLHLINNCGIPYFGVLSEKNEYYHPCPNSPAKKERLEQLIQAFKNTIEYKKLVNNN